MKDLNIGKNSVFKDRNNFLKKDLLTKSKSKIQNPLTADAKVEISQQVKNLLLENNIPKKIQDLAIKAGGQVLQMIPQKEIENHETGIYTSELLKNMKPVQKDLQTPGIFFISGMKIKGISDFNGIREMAENVEGSRHYGWKQKDDVIKEILKRAADEPIILVGHGMGSDSAVEIANELNSEKYNYRPVDLLVTIDSVGLDNDIIPSNVRVNKNFIGQGDQLFNDGPNMAENIETTKIENTLIKDEGHEQLDDAWSVQRQVFEGIEKTLEDHQNIIKFRTYLKGV